MPSLYSHSETGSEKGRKAREEEISWETLGWLTPPRVQNQPKTFPFGFCLVIHLQLQKLQQLDRRSLSTKWEEATDTLNISLKKGGGAELPRKYFPLLFYPLIFEDHTVPFILASGCLWFEYRNPKAFKWRLPMALIELPSTYIHTHTHTHTHTTTGFFPSYALLTDRQPSQLSPAFFLERDSCLHPKWRWNSPLWDPNHSITPEVSNTAPFLLKKKKKARLPASCS